MMKAGSNVEAGRSGNKNTGAGPAAGPVQRAKRRVGERTEAGVGFGSGPGGGRRHGARVPTRRDYRVCRLTVPEWAAAVGQAAALCQGLNYLFFRKLWVLVFFLPLGVWYVNDYRRRRLAALKKRLTWEFRELLGCLSLSLRAGYSVENSLVEAEKELGGMLEPDSPILKELAYINRQVRLSVPVEELLADLGQRSGVEDMENFAAVFISGKRMGGSLSDIVRGASTAISEKLDVEREIEMSMAAKKYEQKIMSAMPCAIIIYMQLTSPGFLNVLYTTTLGMLVMTGSLALYGAAVFWGNRIVNIEV